MRLAVLVWTRAWGGLETHALTLARNLKRAGHDAVLACVGEATAEQFGTRAPDVPLTVLREPAGRPHLVHWIRELRRLESDACLFEKGTLHTGSLGLDLAARLVFGAFVTIEQLEPPVLGPRTSRTYFGLPGFGLWWYRYRLAGWARSLAPQRVVCISEAVRRALHTDYGFSPARTVIVHNGVDVERFHPGGRQEARRRYGILEGATVLATACRLIPQKGVDTAIRALASLAAGGGGRSACLLIAGEGPERPALEALAAELGVSPSVRFVGFLPDTSLFIPAADVFLVPSRIEAQGIAVLEGMASGCCVLASDVGGIPEMIRGTGAGVLLPPDDVAGWAAGMEAMLVKRPEERAAIGAAARQHVEREFDARRQAERLVELLERTTRS